MSDKKYPVLDNFLKGWGGNVSIKEGDIDTETKENGEYTKDGSDGIRVWGVKPVHLAIASLITIAVIIGTVKLVKHYNKVKK